MFKFFQPENKTPDTQQAKTQDNSQVFNKQSLAAIIEASKAANDNKAPVATVETSTEVAKEVPGTVSLDMKSVVIPDMSEVEAVEEVPTVETSIVEEVAETQEPEVAAEEETMEQPLQEEAVADNDNEAIVGLQDKMEQMTREIKNIAELLIRLSNAPKAEVELLLSQAKGDVKVALETALEFNQVVPMRLAPYLEAIEQQMKTFEVMAKIKEATAAQRVGVENVVSIFEERLHRQAGTIATDVEGLIETLRTMMKPEKISKAKTAA